jgi:hypothetical protein
VKYKKGSHNTNADALSRIHVAEGSVNRRTTDSELTKEEKLAIFREIHDKPIGHRGMNRTHDKQTFYNLAENDARIGIYTSM